jgi:hypothetical protein
MRHEPAIVVEYMECERGWQRLAEAVLAFPRESQCRDNARRDEGGPIRECEGRRRVRMAAQDRDDRVVTPNDGSESFAAELPVPVAVWARELRRWVVEAHKGRVQATLGQRGVEPVERFIVEITVIAPGNARVTHGIRDAIDLVYPVDRAGRVVLAEEHRAIGPSYVMVPRAGEDGSVDAAEQITHELVLRRFTVVGEVARHEDHGDGSGETPHELDGGLRPGSAALTLVDV